MSEGKWTKGPWSLGLANFWDVETRGFSIRVDGKKPAIASAGVCEDHVLTISRDFREARPEWYGEYFHPSEVEANARLIAAAPDGDAALVCCVKTLEALFNEGISPHQGEIAAAIRVGRSALAKARGESA